MQERLNSQNYYLIHIDIESRGSWGPHVLDLFTKQKKQRLSPQTEDSTVQPNEETLILFLYAYFTIFEILLES